MYDLSLIWVFNDYHDDNLAIWVEKTWLKKFTQMKHEQDPICAPGHTRSLRGHRRSVEKQKVYAK